MSKTLQEQVNDALNENTQLSTTEMKKRYEQADRITARHGVRGCGAKDERKRLRRMTMNFYGTTLNVLCSLLASVDYLSKLTHEQTVLIAELYQKLNKKEKIDNERE